MHYRTRWARVLLGGWAALALLGAGQTTRAAPSLARAQAVDAANDTGASAVARQPDGKIVAAGHAGAAFALARYTPNGQLDPGFGVGGRVVTVFKQAAYATALALQPDGTIVAAGSTGGRFALARYTPNGQLDPGFGAGGVLTTAFAEGAAYAAGLVLQPDGKLVAAGYAGQDFALARYTSAGKLDPGFGAGGRVTTGFGAEAWAAALALQPDGKLIAAGSVDQDFALARYTPAGKLDPGFGTNGQVITDFGFGEGIAALALQPDGKIVVAGRESNSLALARYLPGGGLDPAFGSGGHVTEDIFPTFYDSLGDVVIQPDGKIVAAGYATVFCTCDIPPTDFALVRFLPNGSPDPAFGDAGKVITEITADNDWATALVLQPDGKAVVAGAAGGYYGGQPPKRFALARYTPNGANDLIITTEFPLPARAYLPAIGRP